MMIPYERKLKFGPQTVWSHHRSGWNYAIHALKDCGRPGPGGVQFEGFLDGFFQAKKSFTDPWIGFLRHTPIHPPSVKKLYPSTHDLTTLLTMPNWVVSLPHCRGLFTLSTYTRDFLATRVPVPVVSLFHPTQLSVPKFQMSDDLGVLSIGHWMRVFDSFAGLRVPYRKTLVKPYKNLKLEAYPDLHVVNWVDNDNYDRLLQRNVVFVHLEDSAANNVIIECLARHTPLVINRLPAVEEYLGADYPLFFTTLTEAEEILGDRERLLAGHRHLRDRDKNKLTAQYFAWSFMDNSIYANI